MKIYLSNLFRLEKIQDDNLTQEEIIQKFKNELAEDTDYRRVEFVGPKVGKELKLMKHSGKFVKHKGASLFANFKIQKKHK